MLSTRQANCGAEGATCWCGKKITSEPGNIRLGCRCLVCYHCLVGVIKSWSKDMGKIQEWGIPCPYINDCEYKKQFRRTFYIDNDQLDFLVTYGQANRESLVSSLSVGELDESFLSENDVRRFKRLAKEKCFRLSCGCYVHYHDLVAQIRNGLLDDRVNDGIQCPNRILGSCRGLPGMFMHRFEIAAVINAGFEFRRTALLPKISPGLDLQHLSHTDLDVFDDRFHRHVQLQCGCFVHQPTCIVHLKSMLKAAESEGKQTDDTEFTRASAAAIISGPSEITFEVAGYQVQVADGTSELSLNSHDQISGATVHFESEARVQDFLMRCPHREHCQHFANTGEYSCLTEKDIDDIVNFGTEKSLFRESHLRDDESAVISGDFCLEQLLLAATNDSLSDPQGAFFEALKRRSLYEVILLLTLPIATRIEINGHGPADGQTALHLAAARGDSTLVSLLLERGADATLADSAGKCAADVAKEACHTETAQLLYGGHWKAAEQVPQPQPQPAAAAAPILGGLSEVSSIVDTCGLKADEILKLKALCASQKVLQADLKAAPQDPASATRAYMQATTKKCPNPACGLPQTHYHGHACHHVREGCYSCKTLFCYRCLATAEENRRERGQVHLCKCGSWSGFCDSGDLLAHLVLHPYPHDSRCGCPICPECRPGQPCQGCGGDCAVCRNLIQPGPSELSQDINKYIQPQTPEQKERYDAEERKRLLFSFCRSGSISSLRAVLVSCSPLGILDHDRMSLAHWASLSGHAMAVQLIVNRVSAPERVAYLDLHDAGCCTALHYACQEGHLAVALTLLFYGASTEVRDIEGYTPILVACQRGHEFIVRLLLAVAHSDAALLAPTGETALYLACLNPNPEVARLLLDHGADVDARDKNGATALIWASHRGHLNVVRLLLDRGAVMDLQDEDGFTALIWATVHCKLDVARMLLDCGAVVDMQANNGYTALIYTCFKGYADVAKLLLDRGAVINMRTKNGSTALIQASYRGHVEVLRLLLDGGACMDLQDSAGSTAVALASAEGQEEVVRILLDRGAAVDLQAKDGSTALIQASFHGHAEVARFLLDRGAAMDIESKDGRTALIWASFKGHLDVVRLLLDRGAAINVNGKDGSTALILAISNRNVEIARLLLDRGASINVEDANRRTALMWAGINNLEHIASLILDRGAAVDAQGDRGWTALVWASFRGSEEAVRLLVDRGAFMDLQSEENRTPLMWASFQGHLEVARLLLDRGAAIDLRAKNCSTALIWATFQGHVAVVRLLLDRGAALNLQSDDGRTALSWACFQGYAEIAALLRDRGATIDSQDKDGFTGLMWASFKGYVGIAKLLLDGGAAVDVQSSNTLMNGFTALIWACFKGYEEVAGLLLDYGAAIDVQSEDGRTALLWASLKGHSNIVKLLLDRGAAIDIKENDSWTALIWACSSCHVEVARLLLDYGAAIDSRSDADRTGLIEASSQGHLEIVELLLDRGAAMDAEDKNGWTALTWACLQDQLEVARFLLDRGAAIDVQSTDGRTALIWASFQGHVEVVRLLLDRGAAIDVRAANGFTAVTWAAAKNHMVVAKLLLDRGAKLV